MKQRGWVSHIRFSPKGDRLAFIDHPLRGDDGGTISVVDLNGKKSDLTQRWASAFGLPPPDSAVRCAASVCPAHFANC